MGELLSPTDLKIWSSMLKSLEGALENDSRRSLLRFSKFVTYNSLLQYDDVRIAAEELVPRLTRILLHEGASTFRLSFRKHVKTLRVVFTCRPRKSLSKKLEDWATELMDLDHRI